MRKKKQGSKFHRCDNAPAVWHEFYDWYASEAGERLQQMEKDVLDEVLPDLFGYHLVYLGHQSQHDRLNASRVSHRTVMNICAQDYKTGDFKSCFFGKEFALPVANDSVDVVVLSHILEFSAYPHEVLREIERILVPEGHVVLLGFNPFSLWTFWRLALGWRGGVPWCGAFRRVTRVKDWLALLGMDMVSTRYYYFRPPINNRRILLKLGFLEKFGRRLTPIFGGAYALVARKRVVTLTPLRTRWQTRKKPIVATGLAEPMSPHQKDVPFRE